MIWRLIRPDAVRVLHDKLAQRSLRRYFGILKGKYVPYFQISKLVGVNFSEDDPIEKLWHIHNNAVKKLYSMVKRIDNGEISLKELDTPKKSLLDLKIHIAKRIIQSCHFCERRCGVNRLKGQLGYCECGPEIEVSSIFHHYGEEPELVPSGTIFTCGCTLSCIHCQNWEIARHYEKGETFDPYSLALQVERLWEGGCRNANLVGGEPTPWLYHWLETFKHVRVNIPVVWNSNSYYSTEAAKLLAGFIDIYLLDFKYGNNRCAEKISDAPRYWEVCTRNHLEASKYGELIIRVLVLPEHNRCCTYPILKWIAENLGPYTRVNVMFQYRPEYRAYEIKELRRRLTEEEIREAIEIAEKVGLKNFIT